MTAAEARRTLFTARARLQVLERQRQEHYGQDLLKINEQIRLTKLDRDRAEALLRHHGERV